MQYPILDIQPGKQTVVASSIGYQTIKKTVSIQRSGTIDFTLEENTLALTSIEVYGIAERNSDAWNISARYRKQDFPVKGIALNVTLSHTFDQSITVGTAYRKYYWDGGYIVSQRNETRGGEQSVRHYKRPLTTARANLDYQLNHQRSHRPHQGGRRRNTL